MLTHITNASKKGRDQVNAQKQESAMLGTKNPIIPVVKKA